MFIGRIRIFATLVSIALASTSSFAVASPKRTPLKDCALASPTTGSDFSATSAKPIFPPVQLDISTPFEPTLFPSGGLTYAVYELHFQNYTDEPMTLRGLEILDASGSSNKPVAAFIGSKLYERLLSIGAGKIDNDHPLEGGKRAVALICLAFDDSGALPNKLSHRVLVGNSAAEGPVIGTRHTALKVLAPPVTGTDWIANNGPRSLGDRSFPLKATLTFGGTKSSGLW